MAGIKANVKTAAMALAASTRKTMAQITAPTNQRVKVLGWSIFFNEEIGDATPSIPLLVSTGLQTGGTGTTNTPVKKEPYAETLQVSAKEDFSVAATTTIGRSIYVNAQSGYEIFYAPGDEPILAGGTLWGIDVTPGATISTGGLSAVVNIFYEE